MGNIFIVCTNCNKKFIRDVRHINENKKLGRKSYCSLRCLGQSRIQRKKIKCDNPICTNIFEKIPSEISSHNYCSHSCAAKISNSNKKKKIRICPNPACNMKFTGFNKYCSPYCMPRKVSKYTKQIIIDEIKKFEKIHNRIPTKKDLMKINVPARKHFNTWNNAIKDAGFRPNPVMYAKKHLANDGHICDSLAEKIIDDWLFMRKIKHERRIKYPGNPSLTADFKIGKYWIEFFGLFGEHKRYDELRREKLELAKQYKLNLIQVYPNQLFPKNQLTHVLNPILH